MLTAFILAMGSTLILLATTVLAGFDAAYHAKENHRLRIENARLLALYDAVTYQKRGMR